MSLKTVSEADYSWIDNWCKIPRICGAPPWGKVGQVHGIVYSEKLDRFIVIHQNNPAVLIVDRDGNIESSWGNDLPHAHGLTLYKEGGEEYLWICDNMLHKVIKYTLDGKEVLSLKKPDIDLYNDPTILDRGGLYQPTWAAQHPETGEIWVADGYGCWLVHRFSADGTYLSTLDGTEGAGRFQEPHGINLFPTGQDGELEFWITDRANHRIVVYGADGTFRRQSDVAHSPCCFDYKDGVVLVPELFTGAKLIDAQTCELITELGKNPEVGPRPDGGWWPPVAPEKWPNLLDTDFVRPGVLNSPHGGCFDPDGNVYIVEWIAGGRMTKFARKS